MWLLTRKHVIVSIRHIKEHKELDIEKRIAIINHEMEFSYLLEDSVEPGYLN